MARALGTHYRIDDEIGRGAVGTVYRGIDTDTGAEVAFRELDRQLAQDTHIRMGFMDDHDRIRSMSPHPNVARTLDLLYEGKRVTVVMEHLAAGDLRQQLANHEVLLPSQVAEIGAGVARGLAALHEQLAMGHGNVRPENVLFAADSTPKLTDFGTTWRAAAADFGRRTGYLPPEFEPAAPPTPAGDVFALGAVLYELSCGALPFRGARPQERRAARPPAPQGIDADLWNLLSRMLSPDPAARPSAGDVADLLTLLEPALRSAPFARPPAPEPAAQFVPVPPPPSGVPMAKRRRRTVALAVAAVVVVVTGGFLVFRQDEEPAALPGPDGETTRALATTSATTTTTSSLPSVVPDFMGKTLAEAQKVFPAVQSEPVVDESVPAGTIVGQDPKAGEPFTGAVKVSVAQKGAITYLAAMPASTSYWSEKDTVAHIAGNEYLHSLSSSTSACQETWSVEYNLSKKARKLEAVAGIDDNSTDSSLQVHLEMFADGAKIVDERVGFGKEVKISRDLAGVLRLKIAWRGIPAKKCPTPNEFVLGDAKLLLLPGDSLLSTSPAATTTTTFR
ncbi:protein kinase domain-containing protein [Lentzea albida]|uniref:non-specific serine/threonine protein kinase n=1 Tax=Lentzea albida TaxID=65499 RepID=A0A1H9UVH6_9PSEU|nr:protein kinase [Lentzea albida]SES13416.1 PASTA domain-containing protein [Lentzea albida]